ncbi:MAG: orotate phosphoribosyltransferase [Chloroflexia bacterium]
MARASSFSVAEEVAEMLLRLGAVALRPSTPFRFASGLLSPIYCDNRLLISYPAERLQVARWFAATIRQSRLSLDVIAGTATAGIPHAAWLAAELGLPMVYVRSQAKGHGQERLVEGVLLPGQRVAVVEDLVTTGGSSLQTVATLREAGAVVEHVFAIFSYAFPETTESFARAGVRLHPLTTLSILLDVAIERGYLSLAERGLVETWAQDPAAWSRAREGAASTTG